MFKRLTVAVSVLFVLATSAFAAGTIPGFSLAQQQDSDGTPLVGCLLYTIQAGTTSTPQSGYQDSALTIPLSNPIICDAYGRLPQIFLADGSIKLRLTKSNGVQVFAADGILVVGASSGGGGGSPVDPTTVIATGDLKARYGTGVLSGFVRANGRTIGSATSGATERANADCQILFQYLWDTDANLTVSTGRGASSAADWAANKTIALPDWRGRTLAGLDDMGNSAAGVLTSASTGFGAQGGNPIVLGNGGGAQSHSLTLTQLPSGITSSGSNNISVNSTSVTLTNVTQSSRANSGGSASDVFNASIATLTSTGSNSIAVTSNNTGAGAHPTMSPTRLATIYIKL
jgi:hypothetical protein